MEEQFDEIEQNNGWNAVFQQIRDEADKLSYQYSSKDSKRRENRDLNRYRDVTPYDHSRVRLSRGCDYINASLVEVEEAGRKYILTQGPLPHTVGHFWLMVWERNSKAILMLNGLIERGAVKCHKYWPDSSDEDLVLDDVDLRVKLLSDEEKEHFTVRTCLLTDVITGQNRQIFHFHYTAWPDFGLPESPNSFLDFLTAVRSSGSLDQSVCGPAIVHCSAGIGRSGTFCLVDSCLLLIERQEDSAKIDVKNILIGMRKYRMGLIQTPEQLRFSFLAIIQGMKQLKPVSNGVANVLNTPESSVRKRKAEDEGVETKDESGSPDGLVNNNPLEEKARIRDEKRKRTEANIRRIKDKSREIEEWKKLSSKLIRYGIFGAALILGAGVLYGYLSRSAIVPKGPSLLQPSLQNLTGDL